MFKRNFLRYFKWNTYHTLSVNCVLVFFPTLIKKIPIMDLYKVTLFVNNKRFARSIKIYYVCIVYVVNTNPVAELTH